MSAETTTLLTLARAYWDAGLCPMPRVGDHVEPSYIDEHGEVQSIPWGQYKVKQPDWPTVEPWFARSDLATVGMLLLTGSHAHPRADHAAFLQILDIESPAVFEALQEELTFAGHAAILHRCVIERTPSAGAHVGFLCRAIGDTQKLALARRARDNKILIELLQHQCCTITPTTIRCKPEHPAGARYHLRHGTWSQPYEISIAQRQVLLDAARVFNEVPEKTTRDRGEVAGNGTRPGDRLNTQADIDWWRTLLLRHDWREVSRPGLASRGVYYFQRPGKIGNQPSATYGKTGSCLYVFSSNALPFEPDTAYTPFAAVALLDHRGDFTQAAQALSSPHPSDVVDPWLGPRQTWCGVPLAVRRITP